MSEPTTQCQVCEFDRYESTVKVMQVCDNCEIDIPQTKSDMVAFRRKFWDAQKEITGLQTDIKTFTEEAVRLGRKTTEYRMDIDHLKFLIDEDENREFSDMIWRMLVEVTDKWRTEKEDLENRLAKYEKV